MDTPKAFISHATADQERFVAGLAERLRANGVDAWYSKWELKDGDSLTERIFEEGIGSADIVIVVLSANSVDRPWVRAELGVGRVQQIEGQCRLMPIVLDRVDVPVALRDTFYRTIDDVGSYDEEFEAMLRSIFNQPVAPPIGQPPAYRTSSTTRRVGRLSATDMVVFDAIAELAIESNRNMIEGPALHARCRDSDLDDTAVVEGVEAIEAAGYLKQASARANRITHLMIRVRLVRRWAESHRDVAQLQKRLVAAIVNSPNDERCDLNRLADELDIERIVAVALLEPYEHRKLLSIPRRFGDHVFVDGVSSLLRRELDS